MNRRGFFGGLACLAASAAGVIGLRKTVIAENVGDKAIEAGKQAIATKTVKGWVVTEFKIVGAHAVKFPSDDAARICYELEPIGDEKAVAVWDIGMEPRSLLK